MDKLGKIISILGIVLLVLIFNLCLLILYNPTGRKAISKYSWTKAICNEDNYCQDYELTCINNNLVSKTSITGAAVQFPETWKDPRSEENKSRLC